ncbi:LysR family transcriptional regulator [Nocardiopsis sp. RSe5-2]|uniref:LysR family transcriptional regulator n=1 Tax=Nocardiopsis endophytica TaxID=3018445 RepID=A0ABT4TZ35_9ACTN|nr:LysR family transcriptional regulator [Nocardiopsis endophytica]MDA2809957.1 LysR family transcriptional regulator [Nocardiopsis endophytica]
MPLVPAALRYFREVARTGSIAVAAADHHITPSSISRQIAKLESEIGRPLFHRHPRGMTLTEAGRRLLAHVHRSELDASALLADIRAQDPAGSSRIAVACTEGFAHSVVPQAMSRLRRIHPAITFRLDVVGREEATRRVAEGDADVAATFAIGRQEDVSVDHSAVVPTYAAVREDHPLASRSRVGFAELCGHPLALSSEGASQRELFDIAARIERVEATIALECDRLAPVYEFVRSGGGAALVSGLGIASGPDSGLVHVPLAHPVFDQRRAQIQTMIGRRRSPAVADFINLLVSRLPPVEDQPPGAGS